MTCRLTVKATVAKLHSRRVSIRRTDWGEWRVNLIGGTEATAYYTTDLEDALDTGNAMAKQRDTATREGDR